MKKILCFYGFLYSPVAGFQDGVECKDLEKDCSYSSKTFQSHKLDGGKNRDSDSICEWCRFSNEDLMVRCDYNRVSNVSGPIVKNVASVPGSGGLNIESCPHTDRSIFFDLVDVFDKGREQEAFALREARDKNFISRNLNADDPYPGKVFKLMMKMISDLSTIKDETLEGDSPLCDVNFVGEKFLESFFSSGFYSPRFSIVNFRIDGSDFLLKKIRAIFSEDLSNLSCETLCDLLNDIENAFSIKALDLIRRRYLIEMDFRSLFNCEGLGVLKIEFSMFEDFFEDEKCSVFSVYNYFLKSLVAPAIYLWFLSAYLYLNEKFVHFLNKQEGYGKIREIKESSFRFVLSDNDFKLIKFFLFKNRSFMIGRKRAREENYEDKGYDIQIV